MHPLCFIFVGDKNNFIIIFVHLLTDPINEPLKILHTQTILLTKAGSVGIEPTKTRFGVSYLPSRKPKPFHVLSYSGSDRVAGTRIELISTDYEPVGVPFPHPAL